jgi:hypothetical protein
LKKALTVLHGPLAYPNGLLDLHIITPKILNRRAKYLSGKQITTGIGKTLYHNILLLKLQRLTQIVPINILKFSPPIKNEDNVLK